MSRRRRSTPRAVRLKKKSDLPSGAGAGPKAPPVTRVRSEDVCLPAASTDAISQTPDVSLAKETRDPSGIQAGGPTAQQASSRGEPPSEGTATSFHSPLSCRRAATVRPSGETRGWLQTRQAFWGAGPVSRARTAPVDRSTRESSEIP